MEKWEKSTNAYELISIDNQVRDFEIKSWIRK